MPKNRNTPVDFLWSGEKKKRIGIEVTATSVTASAIEKRICDGGNLIPYASSERSPKKGHTFIYISIYE